MKALVTGANRGIGYEFCRQLAMRGDEVVAVCRAPSKQLVALVEEGDRVRIIDGIDVTREDSISELTEKIGKDKIDLLINNAGIMEGVTLGNPDFESVERQFAVNALAPLRVTQGLLDHLADGAKLAIVTSRMGSIEDNDSGGSYGYRMSKAAANMVGRSLSIDLRDRGIAVALLHPGWVRTDMTGGNGLIEADESARGLIAILDQLVLEKTGLFWHTNGEILPW